MKFLILLLMVSSPAMAWGKKICRGQVSIERWNTVSDVDLEIHELNEGATFALYHPITSDFEMGVSYRIHKVEMTPVGLLVEAKTEDAFIDGMINFEVQGERLLNFQGVEGDIDFGPGTLMCGP